MRSLYIPFPVFKDEIVFKNNFRSILFFNELNSKKSKKDNHLFTFFEKQLSFLERFLHDPLRSIRDVPPILNNFANVDLCSVLMSIDQ